jgi:hypothetical protein
MIAIGATEIECHRLRGQASEFFPRRRSVSKYKPEILGLLIVVFCQSPCAQEPDQHLPTTFLRPMTRRPEAKE